MRKIESNFTSCALRCSGLLYLPVGVAKPPVVIMAHGFGAERTFGLEPFAERFVERGLAVYMFDYRNFNGSEGEPRNLVSPSRHLQDWRSAVTHVRDLTDIDSSRIALWGTSFSGGHVLVTAARDNGINAAVIQVPFTDGLASAAIYRPHQVLRAAWHGLLDVLSIPLGIQPHYVPMVSLDGEFAVLSTPDARQGYLTLVPENTTWKNQCPARILFTILSYRPTTYAARLTCPTLVVMAEQDSLIPGSSVEAMVRRLRKCEVLRLPIRHFDAYTGDSFETVVKREAEFLRKYLAA